MNARLFDLPRWLWITLAVCLGYHCLTLPYSPLPWFDETYFASMTRHFVLTGEFIPDVGPMLDYYYPQSKAYGPGYFMVTSLFQQVFGLSLFWMRFPGLVFGMLFVAVAYKLLEISDVKRVWRLAFVCFLLTDTIFLQNIHSARMDSMALFMVATGFWFFLKASKNQHWTSYGLAGLFFGLAMLTTPRVAVSIMGVAVVSGVLFIHKPSLSRFKNYLLMGFLIPAVYSVWVFWGFGGPVAFWNYFFGPPKEQLYFENLAQGYMGSTGYVPAFQWPVLVSVVVMVLLLAAWKKWRQPLLFWISVVNMLTFYKLVNDTGIYSVFCMPYAYFILVIGANQIEISWIKASALPSWVALILVLNLGIFTVKNLAIWLTMPAKNQTLVTAQISNIIPKGSKVIGDEVYYYSVLQAGSDFQYLNRGASTYQRYAYHENEYGYQFAVVRNPNQFEYEFNHYNRDKKLVEIGRISMPELSSSGKWLKGMLQKAKIPLSDSYQGIVYRYQP